MKNKLFKRKIIFIGFFILLSFQLFSENISGKLINKDNDAVPYASVYLANKYVGVMSNSEGEFSIPKSLILNDDTLVISCLGYETLKFDIQDLTVLLNENNNKILLNNRTIELTEVVVMPSENNIINYGFDKLRSANVMISGKTGSRLAVFIENEDAKVGIIKSVNIKLKRFKDENIKLRIHFYTKTDNGFELNNLIKENIFISDFSKKKTEVDVTKYNIPFLEEGVYIGIEWINTNEGVVDFTEKFGPNILCTTKKETKATWIFEDNEWQQFPPISEEDINSIPNFILKKILKSNAQVGISVY